MKPTVGRIVHYTDRDGSIHAAIITGVVDDNSGDVTLTTFPPGKSPGYVGTGVGLMALVPFSELPESEHWNWPPRV